MAMGIQYSRRSVLGNEEWRTTSCVSINDHEQSLYDIGFDIGALLEDIKALMDAQVNSTAVNNPPDPSLESLIHRMVEVDYALECWWDRLKAWVPGPLYWQERCYKVNEDRASASRGLLNDELGDSAFVYSDLRLAHLSMDHFALHIMVSLILTRTLAAIPAPQPSVSFQHFMALASRHDEAYRLSLGKSILKSIDYTRRPQFGFVGPQRSIFSIRVALTAFRDIGGPHASAMAKITAERLREIDTDLGIRFAEVLEKDCGDWD